MLNVNSKEDIKDTNNIWDWVVIMDKCYIIYVRADLWIETIEQKIKEHWPGTDVNLWQWVNMTLHTADLTYSRFPEYGIK